MSDMVVTSSDAALTDSMTYAYFTKELVILSQSKDHGAQAKATTPRYHLGPLRHGCFNHATIAWMTRFVSSGSGLYSPDEPRSCLNGGAGLGLAIAKQLVRLSEVEERLWNR